MNLLITGGTGFTGANIALLEQAADENEIFVSDINPSARFPERYCGQNFHHPR